MVRFFGQAHESVDDSRISVCRWVKEQPVLNKADDRGYGASLFCGCWADDGDRTELLAKKQRWLGHDQIGLEFVGGSRGAIIGIDATIQIRKRKITIGDVGRIACLVVPSLKMHDLRSADAQQDSEHFQIGDLLGQGRIKAAAALLDESKVKSSGAGNRLQVGRWRPVSIQYKIVIAEGNGRMLPLGQVRHRVLEAASEVGILQRVAVSGPPLRIHGQMLQVGESSV